MTISIVVRVLAFAAVTSPCAAFPFDSADNGTITDIVWVTVGSTPTNVAIIEASGSVTAFLLSPAPSQNPGLSIPSITAIPAPVVITDVLTATITATLTEPPATVTVSAPPQTVTSVLTISPLPPAPVPQTAWTAPAQMVDLAAFNITNFASGQQNLHIINAIPVDTTVITLDVMANTSNTAGNSSSSPDPGSQWDNSTSVLQTFYPANSINPAQEPQGGADFYATPLDLYNAQNVSLEYSVFFPADFDWVQGGKLPGIYGGHMGCSGGDAAVTCFSTRLMWRTGGAGELYLYAPKDKQTEALCETPPLSVCDAAYGLSIGRGSFNFTQGGWTRVRQTISLNTPGEQDGGFTLDVDGQRVIDRSDVFYRDAPQLDSGDGDPDNPDDSNGDDSDDSGDDDSGDSGDDSGGIINAGSAGQQPDVGSSLGGVLGNLLVRVAFWPAGGVLVLRDDTGDADADPALLPSPTSFAELQVTDAAASAILAGFMQTAAPNATLVQEIYVVTSTSTASASPLTQVITPTATTTTAFYPSVVPTDVSFIIEDLLDASQPVRFTGLFFSTFFGGHEPEYATPKDQYAWFKDFSMTINN